jgi:hypothetical protein
MTRTITCDYCGKPIDVNDQISINVTDRYLPKMSDLKTEKLPTLHADLDLHRECYIATLLPHIKATKL